MKRKLYFLNVFLQYLITLILTRAWRISSSIYSRYVQDKPIGAPMLVLCWSLRSSLKQFEKGFGSLSHNWQINRQWFNVLIFVISKFYGWYRKDLKVLLSLSSLLFWGLYFVFSVSYPLCCCYVDRYLCCIMHMRVGQKVQNKLFWASHLRFGVLTLLVDHLFSLPSALINPYIP